MYTRYLPTAIQSLHCWQISCFVGERLVEYPLLTAPIQSLHCWQIFRSVGEPLVVYPILTDSNSVPSLLTDFSFRWRTAGCTIPATYRGNAGPSLLTDFSFRLRTAGCIIPAAYRGNSVPSLLTDFRSFGEPLVVYPLLTAAFSPFIADRFFVPLENRWLYIRYLPTAIQSLHCWQIFRSVGEPLVVYPLLTAEIQCLLCWRIFRFVGGPPVK